MSSKYGRNITTSFPRYQSRGDNLKSGGCQNNRQAGNNLVLDCSSSCSKIFLCDRDAAARLPNAGRYEHRTEARQTLLGARPSYSSIL